jgi:Protein kinase domain
MKPPLETSLAYKYFVAYRLYDGQRFDEVVIPYRAKNSMQKKLRKLLRNQKFIFAGLVLTCFFAVVMLNLHLFSAPGAAIAFPMPLLLVLAAAAASWSTLETYNGMQPTHFGLSDKGLRLYWIHWFGDNDSGYVPWNAISHVRLRKEKELAFFNERWIDFMKDNGVTAFSLRVDGIATGEQRKRLHLALKQYLPPQQIDPALNDLLNPVKVDGYTQLWLEVLATSPQRIHQDSLTVNSMIANDRYEIIEQIGAGGQGTAYLGRARAGALGPNSEPLDVVLKEFVLPYHAGLGVSKKALDNIQREAELLSHLRHPQIVKLVDIFVEDQRAYLVLEHIAGESLRHIVERQGPFSEAQAISLGLQMCEILNHLHSQRPPVLHRDFTPDNLIMGLDGQLKLIDFNVAQQMHSNATRTVVGKHSFIPPEQFRGKATPQSDVYAMGATLYFLLTGKLPEPISVAHPRQIESSVSPEFDAVVAQATAPDCDVRFGNAEAVKDALLNLQSGTGCQGAAV